MFYKFTHLYSCIQLLSCGLLAIMGLKKAYLTASFVTSAKENHALLSCVFVFNCYRVGY